ncbi:hypothetical protein ABH920_006569 [Catenulispora sp. EB89]
MALVRELRQLQMRAMAPLGATNWPPKHIKGLNPILRIEALTCDVTVGLTGFEPATP